MNKVDMSLPSYRIEWLDMAKGYGIILVIIGHCDFPDSITSFIYAFHMPLFFFLSGCVFNVKDNFSSFLQARIRRMLIPYFCLIIPMILADLYLRDGFSFDWEDVLENVKCVFIQNRYTTLWFLACLIVLNIIMYAVIRTVKNERRRISIVLLLSVSGLTLWRMDICGFPWNLDAALVVLPFFYTGYVLKGRISEGVVKRTGKFKVLAIVVLFGVGVYLLNYLNCSDSDMRVDVYLSNFNHAFLTYFVAVMGIAMMILLSMCYNVPMISYIGRNSLTLIPQHYYKYNFLST